MALLKNEGMVLVAVGQWRDFEDGAIQNASVTGELREVWNWKCVGVWIRRDLQELEISEGKC